MCVYVEIRPTILLVCLARTFQRCTNCPESFRQRATLTFALQVHRTCSRAFVAARSSPSFLAVAQDPWTPALIVALWRNSTRCVTSSALPLTTQNSPLDRIARLRRSWLTNPAHIAVLAQDRHCLLLHRATRYRVGTLPLPTTTLSLAAFNSEARTLDTPSAAE